MGKAFFVYSQTPGTHHLVLPPGFAGGVLSVFVGAGGDGSPGVPGNVGGAGGNGGGAGNVHFPTIVDCAFNNQITYVVDSHTQGFGSTVMSGDQTYNTQASVGTGGGSGGTNTGGVGNNGSPGTSYLFTTGGLGGLCVSPGLVGGGSGGGGGGSELNEEYTWGGWGIPGVLPHPKGGAGGNGAPAFSNNSAQSGSVGDPGCGGGGGGGGSRQGYPVSQPGAGGAGGNGMVAIMGVL